MNTSKRLALIALVALAATVVYAQGSSKGRDSDLRSVRGTVVDKDEAPVEAAVVYLKNLRTQDIITHITDAEGQFRFTGLDLNADYEVHAEREGLSSSPRSISNFDSRKEFVVTLKLDRKKPVK